MHYTQLLEGVECPVCNEEEIYWWWEDETESTIEIYANCDGCGREFPKRFVDKSEDTSDSALRKKAMAQVR